MIVERTEKIMNLRSALTLVGLLICGGAHAQQFGSTQIVDYAAANRIFVGTGVIYVTFSGANLSGCSGNVGGYVSASWPAANGGVESADKASRFVATFLYAKSQGTLMEVRYRVNSAGGGWDNCAIDAIFLR